MKMVYICHPYSCDPDGNRKKIGAVFKLIRMHCKNVVPFSPVHAFGEFYDDGNDEDRQEVLKLCTGILKRCDEVWVFGRWWESEGCRLEVKTAESFGIPVRFFDKYDKIDDLGEVSV